MFDAFGVSADTDTDTLVGSYAILSIGTRTIQKGARAGQLANTIREVLPYADADGVAPGDESA
jgi:hypothetical protein